MNEDIVGAIGQEPKSSGWQSKSRITERDRYNAPSRINYCHRGRRSTRWQDQSWQPNQQWQGSGWQWGSLDSIHHANTQTFRPGGENEPQPSNITKEPMQRASAQATQPTSQEKPLN